MISVESGAALVTVVAGALGWFDVRDRLIRVEDKLTALAEEYSKHSHMPLHD